MNPVSRLFSEGFRIFFLVAALYGVFTGLVWCLFLAGIGNMPAHSVAPTYWHAHEMIFGYAIAAIGGFFLTAVPNWTNTPGARQGFIATAAGLWLAGRFVVWYAGLLPAGIVAVVDLAFIPILAAKILTQLLKRPKPQNMMFLAFLVLLWSANLAVHLEWMGLTSGTEGIGLRAGLIILCSLISVLGGRVTPAFTRNAMKRAGVPEARWPKSAKNLERAAVVLALGMPVLVLAHAGNRLTGSAAILLGAVQILRLLRWGGLWCLTQPILIALHLGLAMLGVGMIAWGLAGFGLGDEIAALHLLGIGAVGGMTIAVMSRAVLGHSGRPLVAPLPVAAGYGLIALAAVLRWSGAGMADLYLPVMLSTGALWIAAFALFILGLWPAITGPRVGQG
ncbi:MAG: NnrS family protein [Rhodobacteraceae bacterium]|nr:NnrS family protein [Paracoccaceae bacterium]